MNDETIVVPLNLDFSAFTPEDIAFIACDDPEEATTRALYVSVRATCPELPYEAFQECMTAMFAQDDSVLEWVNTSG